MTSIDINDYQDNRLAELHEVKVSGLPGMGTYTLLLNMFFTVFPPKVDTYLQQLSIRVDWGDNSQRMLGFAIPEAAQPIHISPHNNKLQIGFRMPLIPNQMEAIESARQGSGIKLSIMLIGEVGQGLEKNPIQQYGTVDIPQQQWVEALEKMEYRKTLLFEMCLPDSLNEHGELVPLIHKAMHHMYRGNYDECVAECRKLLEAYPIIDDDSGLLKNAKSKYKGTRDERESMNLAERFSVLRDALKHSTHLSHHHNPGDGYSRDHARVILGMVVAMLGGSIK